VWDIVPRAQVAAFRRYLSDNRHKFWHKGRRVDRLPNLHDVVFDQVFMLQVGAGGRAGVAGGVAGGWGCRAAGVAG
jgi:hypothetical protein